MLISAIGICGENEDKVCGGAVAQGSVGVVDELGGGKEERCSSNRWMSTETSQ